jgi:mono/diheme cytochrome c family protein
MNSKGLIAAGLSLLLAAGLVLSGATHLAKASPPAQGQANVTRGAMLYDKWFAVLGTAAPAGNMPIWGRQTTNTRSGEDTWRCVSCHGWDYQGKDGAYRSGSGNYTGFPGVYIPAQSMSAEELVKVMKGSLDAEHDFSKYLDDASLNDLAGFLMSELADDSQFIDPQTLAVKNGDPAHGMQLYDGQCAKCHGADGTTLKVKLDGKDANLGTLAAVDPWRFLHKTRFGNPGTEMVVGYDLGWTAQDGRDVLFYAQSLPSALELQTQQPSLNGRSGEADQPGGPAQSIFTGILTALGAVFTGLGFAVLLGLFLIGVLLVVVWLVRGKSK